MAISPADGVSSKPSSDKSVVFPDPDGPIIATVSPGIIEAVTFSKIEISPAAVEKRLCTPSIVTIGSVFIPTVYHDAYAGIYAKIVILLHFLVLDT